ncbi:RidA family protein [Acetobacter tropicalis]|uniref:Endoribonuclease L-PSP n=2 Tax=Acetobacter TaxID=434 RepID=A0A252EHG2_9PROT|nr:MULTISPECIES: RidA family protein [Acetobacter]ATJ89366.1 RidA family protein [Acetobacter tropicalis]OUL65930.1 endoribonuclease L-PSP [Acetobacter senegalensis]
MSITRLDPHERLSGAVIHNSIVYLAGQVSTNTTLDAEGQTANILTQIDSLLAQAGSNKANILSVQIFLPEIADIGAMNKAWDAWLDTSNKPARATVEAKLADPQWKVEITLIAKTC